MTRIMLFRITTLITLIFPFIVLPCYIAAHAAEKEVVAYFTSWGIYGRGYTVKNILTSQTADKLTVINYAFANVTPSTDDGQVVCKLGDEWADYQKAWWSGEETVGGEPVVWPNRILGNFHQLKALKTLYPNIKILISLGGWTWSAHFSDAALTAESRTAFVKSCVDLFIKGDLPNPYWGGMGGRGAAAGVFDGIDVDWEYPAAAGHPHNIVRPEDTQNFTALLAEFRKQLNEFNPNLLLTIAAPAAEAKFSKMELAKIHPLLDFINVMTYDFHGAWDPKTNHQANLFLNDDHDDNNETQEPTYSVDKSIKGFTAAGVPANKLVMGLPFYGKGWTNVKNKNRGLYQSADGAAPGTWEAGNEDYKILKDYVTAGYKQYWDEESKAAWLFNGNNFWTFEDDTTLCYKMNYVQKKELRGAMFWELSGDTTDGELISSIDRGLKNRKSLCEKDDD